MKSRFLSLVIIYTVANISSAKDFLPLSNIPEDATLNFTQLARKYGCETQVYNVTTADGYILTLHRIPGDVKKPILIVHGGQDSSDSFLLRGNRSLAVALHKAGYDVWACNFRGNKYSRRHITLDPDKDKQYWSFSIHEIAYYDVPAFVDFILTKTGEKQLRVIAMSQSTTMLFALGAIRPEYNEKIKLLIALAPLVYMEHVGPFVSAVVRISPILDKFLSLIGQEEILANNLALRALQKFACPLMPSRQMCGGDLLVALSGYDSDTFADNFQSVAFAHYPCGTSRRTFIHSLQPGIRNKFSQFDYGTHKNYLMYNSSEPPDYDLSKVVMNTSIFVAKNDLISTIKDVDRLRSELPNVIDYRIMKREQMNHFDFSWGLGMEHYLFPDIFDVLDKY